MPLFTRIYLWSFFFFCSWSLLLACSSEIESFYTRKLVLNKKTKTSDLLPKGHNERWLYKIVNPLNQWWTKSLSVHETWVCIQWIVYLLKSKFSVLHHMLSHYISIKSVSWLLVTFTNVFQFGNILKCLSSCLFPPKHVFIFYLLCIICFVYKLVSIKSIS